MSYKALGRAVAGFMRLRVEQIKADLLRREIARHRKMRAPRLKGGQTRGQQITQRAMAGDAELKRLWKRWQTSDELQDAHRSFLAYARTVTGRETRTLQRRVRALGLASRQ